MAIYIKNPIPRTASQIQEPGAFALCSQMTTKNSVGFFSFIQYGVESEGKRNGLNTILYCF